MSKRLSNVSAASAVSATDRFPIVNSSDQVRLAEVGDIPSPSTVAADIALAKASAQAFSIARANHSGQDSCLAITKAGNYTVEAIYLQNPTIISVTAAATITIPTDANAPNVPVGAKLLVLQTTSGTATMAGAVGVTLLSATTLTGAGANSLLHLLKVGPNAWHVGSGVSGTPSGTAPTPVAKPTFTVPPVITYDSAAVGGVSTVSTGTTDVTAARTYAWGFSDSITNPGVIYEGYVSPADTDTTYTHLLADVGSQMWCDVTATSAGGSTTVRAIGPTITGAAAPAPPPPASGSTRGVTISSFTTSGNITATSGTTYYGLDFTSSGINVTIPVTVSDVLFDECRFSGELLCQGVRVTFRHCTFNDYDRSLLNDRGTFITVELCRFNGASTGAEFEGHAITNNYSNGPFVIDRCHFVGTYNTDCISNYQSSRVTMTNNTGTVDIQLASGAAFTMGDGLVPSPRGRDNYIAFNQIAQTGIGVPSGVFGSDGNTIIEYNCFPQGIQAYAYPNENPGNFLGVVIRHNLINFGASYLPADPFWYGGAEYSTNVDGTDCNLTPSP